MPDKATNDSVCAIVVTYHPRPEVLRGLLASIVPQVGAVLVVDNGSPPETLQPLQDATAGERLAWLELGDNVGLGAAHNLGIAWARRRGYSFVLLLDHDSLPAANMVAELLAGYRACSQSEPVAAFGPAYVDPRTETPGPFVRFGTVRNQHVSSNACDGGPVRVDFLISSGSLIPLATVDAVGGMDDGLFVDYVDTEWSLRAASLGYRLCGVPTAIMRHTIGDRVRRFGPFRVHEYSPLRLYYNIRNRWLLQRKPCTPPAWMIRSLLHTLRLLLIYGVLVAPRWANLRMLCRGLRDAWSGRAGRMDLSRQPAEWRAVLDRASQRAADVDAGETRRAA